MEQIFNSKVLIEKHLQHQMGLLHNFIDFKESFDLVWHGDLWHILKGFNLENGPIHVIQALCDHATDAILLNNLLGEFFQTTIGVRQGCVLSPTLVNLFPERIMQQQKTSTTTPLLSSSVGDISASYALRGNQSHGGQ